MVLFFLFLSASSKVLKCGTNGSKFCTIGTSFQDHFTYFQNLDRDFRFCFPIKHSTRLQGSKTTKVASDVHCAARPPGHTSVLVLAYAQQPGDSSDDLCCGAGQPRGGRRGLLVARITYLLLACSVPSCAQARAHTCACLCAPCDTRTQTRP